MLALLPVIAATPLRLTADPLPMSDVSLTGEWAAQTQRNQDVLLSLNASQWACHFTTTANLTACLSTSVPWQTYLKATRPSNFSRPSSNFSHKLGFLAAGDDVVPPATVSFAACLSFCEGSAACRGVTFHAADPTPSAQIHCYWKSAVHFTPTPRSANCVAPGDPSKPVCEPLPGEMGLGGYYGHYQGHWLSATAFLLNASGNATVRARADDAVATLALVMDTWHMATGVDGYLFPYSPIVWDKLLSGHGAGPYYSVPFYTLHKLMAGLLDQYVFAGSALALRLVLRMAAWVHAKVEATLAAGGEALWQRVLLVEWGGMNDVLMELYRHTADPTHLQTARRFNGWVFTARLAAGHDDLADLPFPHANFHLPEIVGNARAYELTGNATDARVVHTFFDALTANHSYATGGSNSGECWQQPRDLGNFLSTQTEESCTQYNVLKVARHLFRWHASPRYADFYERGIFNGIVGNQKAGGRSSCGTPAACDGGRSPGARGASGATSYIYMLPLGGAVRKAWGKSDFGFPCCWGTLSESFAKLSDSIFFAAPDGSALYVNLYVSATAKWAARAGVTIEQRAHFPSDALRTTTLTVRVAAGSAPSASAFALQLRVPSWLQPPGAARPAAGARVTVNGEVWPAPPVPGTFLGLKRVWRDGDVVEASFPPTLWTAPLEDSHAWHNATVAFMYGPLVLAGVGVRTDIFVPRGDARVPATFLRRNSTSAASALEFEATAVDGTTIRLIPLRDVTDEQYVVYFYTAGTKPPQPPVQYCPHSSGGLHTHTHAHAHAHGSGEEEEEALITEAAAPSAPAGSGGRGVQWSVTPAGQMVHVRV